MAERATREPPESLDFPSAVERFLYDARGLGRLTTERSAAEYRRTVLKHAAAATARDPRLTDREDVKATLRRWDPPEPWQAFHSIDWLERDAADGSNVGEIDFVLAHPEQGIVTLEVKGGGIECNHGAWKRRRPDGKWEQMKDPVKQVRDSQFALARLLERTPEWPIEKPFMSHGLAFPLSSVHQFSLGPGTDPQIIIDRNDTKDLPRLFNACSTSTAARVTSTSRLARRGWRHLSTCWPPR